MIDWDGILKRVNRDITTGRVREFEGREMPAVPYPTLKALLLDLYRIRWHNYDVVGRYLCVSTLSARRKAVSLGVETYPAMYSGKRVDTRKRAILDEPDTSKMEPNEIAEKLGCCPTTVRTVLRAAGREWKRGIGGRKTILRDKKSVDLMMHLRLVKKMSAVDVALQIGCSPSFVQKIWRENGLFGRLPRLKKWNSTHAG